MGDAFLDAGAHAVVQTFWPIEDRDARRFVERFVAIWNPGDDPVAALADTRRAAIRAGEPPWVWAAWSIHVAGVPTSSLARVP
jgi:CHAT domain-containing protein